MIAVAAPGFLGHLPSISDLGVNRKIMIICKLVAGYSRIKPEKLV